MHLFCSKFWTHHETHHLNAAWLVRFGLVWFSLVCFVLLLVFSRLACSGVSLSYAFINLNQSFYWPNLHLFASVSVSKCWSCFFQSNVFFMLCFLQFYALNSFLVLQIVPTLLLLLLLLFLFYRIKNRKIKANFWNEFFLCLKISQWCIKFTVNSWPWQWS